MLARLTPAVARLAALPMAMLASCHLVGGTGDLYIDPDFHTQSGGGTASSGGAGGEGGSAVTTTGGGGDGGGVEICNKDECEGTDTDCALVACLNNTCGFTNEPLLKPCENETGFCDGSGSCVQCINDNDTPCDNGGPCQNFVCQEPGCGDDMRNGSETDVDCGGSCGPCGVGAMCGVDGDCLSSMCSGTCVSCATSGCDTFEYCDGSTGRCEDQKAPTESCGGDDECLSGCCFLNVCTLTTSLCG